MQRNVNEQRTLKLEPATLHNQKRSLTRARRGYVQCLQGRESCEGVRRDVRDALARQVKSGDAR